MPTLSDAQFKAQFKEASDPNQLVPVLHYAEPHHSFYNAVRERQPLSIGRINEMTSMLRAADPRRAEPV